jgi:hypothetical protein
MFSVIVLFFFSAGGCIAAECENISEEYSRGSLTSKCLQKVIENFATYQPHGFFVVTIPSKDNVYVQGLKSEGNSFLMEAVSPEYTSDITPDTVSGLLKLGWNLPSELDDNFFLYVNAEDIFDGTASKLLLEALLMYPSISNQDVVEYQIFSY